MRQLSFRTTIIAAFSIAVISSCHSQSPDYSDLEALDINCPAKNRCRGYRNNLTYMDRSCECDLNCTAYKDCCIDALPDSTSQTSRPSARTDVTCLHYGGYEHSGVYVINKCSSSWNGPGMVREKCVGDDDFSDPLSAAPATDVEQNITYRNLACAECNNANLDSLTTFGMRLKCYGLEESTEEQIMGNLTYNEERHLWGVNRLNRFGNGTEFIGCNIIYDVQGYLNSSVRFCRSNLVPTCDTSWTRQAVARLCAQYMAVVYSNTNTAYRNPHCALCNHKNAGEIFCDPLPFISRRPERNFAFPDMLDINPTDGEEVGMKKVDKPNCPSRQKYDPFTKRCRRLMCALPGHSLVNGKCQRV